MSRLDLQALPPIRSGRPYRAELWLAASHLTSSGQMAALLVAIFAVLAVAVGVATVNIVLSVMAGFEIDLRDKILGANAHAVVLSHGGAGVSDPDSVLKIVRGTPGVAAAAPFVYYEGIAHNPWATTGIVIKGVDPATTGDVTDVLNDLVVGPMGPIDDDATRRTIFEGLGEPICTRGHSVGDPDCDPLPGLIIGIELQSQLMVEPLDEIQVIDPVGGGTGPFGVPMSRVKRFRIAAIYKSGMYDYDTKWVYAANAPLQEFLALGPAVSGIEIKVTDIYGVKSITAEIEKNLGYPFYCRDWQSMNADLFMALALEKQVMGLILFLIVVVSSWLIMTTVIMVVLDKRREIAVLKAMGANWPTILRVFLIEGCVIGFFGTALGTGLGLGGCAFLDWYGYPLSTNVYFLSTLPVVVEPINVVVIAVAAFLTCTFVTLVPAAWAASQDPITGLRGA